MKKVSLLIVGAGGRGQVYSDYIRNHPEEGEIVGVCEPRDDYRAHLADDNSIPESMRFRDWRDVIDKPRLADVAAICTQDQAHKEPAIALAKKGYHLLLEKPMAISPRDCIDIRDAAKENGVILAVCHVLRYTPFVLKIRELLEEGLIGRIQNIQLLEPVGYWHQAHSYVRGNWRNEAESSPMLLAKSCHDIDLLTHLMPSQCNKVASFGTLSYFTRANQPVGASDRCTDCPESIESKCPYSALKVYIRTRNGDYKSWPVGIISFEGTYESTMRALKEGPYGRCVYACDNDVVDHQVVQMNFEDGAVASFTMSAFTQIEGREIYIMGDRGNIRCTDAGLFHTDFLTDEVRRVPIEEPIGGHAGGDYGLMKAFLTAVATDDRAYITSGPDASLKSHLIVFAAEKSRRDGTVEAV